MAWQMRHPPLDWLDKELGYDGYCQCYAGGHPMPCLLYTSDAADE